jgi:hypothetical protein
MTCPRHDRAGFRLRRCGCASWSRSTTAPNPRRDTRRKRRKSSRANGRKDKPEQGKKTLTKWPREFPLELRTKTFALGVFGSWHEPSSPWRRSTRETGQTREHNRAIADGRRGARSKATGLAGRGKYAGQFGRRPSTRQLAAGGLSGGSSVPIICAALVRRSSFPPVRVDSCDSRLMLLLSAASAASGASRKGVGASDELCLHPRSSVVWFIGGQEASPQRTLRPQS